MLGEATPEKEDQLWGNPHSFLCEEDLAGPMKGILGEGELILPFQLRFQACLDIADM